MPASTPQSPSEWNALRRADPAGYLAAWRTVYGSDPKDANQIRAEIVRRNGQDPTGFVPPSVLPGGASGQPPSSPEGPPAAEPVPAAPIMPPRQEAPQRPSGATGRTDQQLDLGPFAKWVALDLTADLLPVMPAGTRWPIEAGSRLQPDQLGKVPSFIKDGAIHGLARWTEGAMTVERLALFHGMAAEHGVILNVGLQTRHRHALDLDLENEALVAAILARYEGVIPLHESGLRIGRSPHVLALFEIDGPARHKASWVFTDPLDNVQRVEWLGLGQYCVIDGLHPRGMAFQRVPYKGTGRIIDQGMPTTKANPLDLDAAWSDVPEIAASFGMTLSSGRASRNVVDAASASLIPPEALAAPSIAAVKEALSHIRLPAKGSKGQWDINRWIALGHELHGASGGAAEICAAWIEFSAGYDERAAAHAEAAWPSFAKTERGWWELRERAAAESGGKYSGADQDFTSIGEGEPNDKPNRDDQPPADFLNPVPTETAPTTATAESESEVITAPTHSDEALALGLIDAEKQRVRYVAAWSRWLVWNDCVWQQDETLAALALSRRYCRRVAKACAHPPTRKSLASAKTIFNVERLARADRRIAVKTDQLDTDPWLLNTPGGVVDLRSGELRTHDPALLMTKCTLVAPDATMPAPVFTNFLRRITAGNDKVSGYLQRLFGYALTGLTTEQMFAFWWGAGSNGKSTLLELMLALYGDFGVASPMSTFVSGVERHPTELAILRGARLAGAIEVERGQYWSEAKIKQLTGGDRITARFMRQDFFTFAPSHTLIIAGNKPPGLHNVDTAMRRRLHLVPFTVTIPEDERDKSLPMKLLAEGPAVMAWALAGCLKWQRISLQPPAEVVKATDEYFAQEDILAQWISECCLVGPTQHATYDELWQSFKGWAERNNAPSGDRKTLVTTLMDRGFEKWRQPRTGQRGLAGIGAAAGADAGDDFDPTGERKDGNPFDQEPDPTKWRQ